MSIILGHRGASGYAPENTLEAFQLAMDMGAEIEFASVESVEKADGAFRITTEDDTFHARTLIFAGGARPRPLGVDREEELTGAGVSYCALCDGAQSLTPHQFDELAHRIRLVREAVR